MLHTHCCGCIQIKSVQDAFLAKSLLKLFPFFHFFLTEEEDRDLSCVVSSLVQLMLDPHYRSLIGFQSLVQKEWVMAGHRFLDRCNHLKKNEKEEVIFLAVNTPVPDLLDMPRHLFFFLLSVFLSVKSPLFTLFLDCVWQMTNQYPAAFEFTEAYLTVLSDSMWIPLFSTFLFNSPKQRAQHLMVSDTYI